jgi:hypothetical protein
VALPSLHGRPGPAFSVIELQRGLPRPAASDGSICGGLGGPRKVSADGGEHANDNAAIRVERRPGRHGRDRRRGRLAGAGPAWSGGSEPSEPILRPPRAGSEFSQALLSQRGGLIGPSPKDRRRPRLSGCGTLDLNARSLAVIVCLRHSDSVDISAYAPICMCMHFSEARRT